MWKSLADWLLAMVKTQAGVKECWLVLGPEKQIEVHRQPAGEQFAETAVHGPGGAVASTAVPGFAAVLDDLYAAA